MKNMECKNCGNYFSSKIKIDGKLRHLNNRKYCFSCSPFGKHNTRKIHLPNNPTTRICAICGKSYLGGHGKYKEKCPSCSVSEYRIKLKKEMVEMMGGKCIVCGYNRCIAALEFHHIDPSKKEITLSGSTKNKKNIFEELKKCKLVCNRCHREIHSGVVQW